MNFNNFNSNIEKMNDVLHNELALAALFELGKNERMTILNMMKNLSVDEKELQDKIMFLEALHFIKQNPAKDEAKLFLDRKYVIDIQGMFFLNKVKNRFPQYKDSFNFFF